jgi:two-component system, OmpR family, KDP operon response regulator KdpE
LTGPLLVVEDETAMAMVLTQALEARGFTVRIVETGSDALAAMTDDPPVLVVLDLGLPDMDGIDLCRIIRSRWTVPIIVVTADGAEDRKVAALDLGADDYITKPFSIRELEARVRVGLRHREGRENSADAAVLEVGDVVVDVTHHWVTVAGQLVELTAKEFDFLTVLARNPGRVLTHGAILAEAWGAEGAGHVEYLRVYARSLRRKLGDDRANPRIVTEPGVGYRMIARS